MAKQTAANPSEETIRIAGALTWTIDGKAIAVGSGQAVYIPRGAVHRFDNFGTEDAKQLSIVTQGIMGPAYFREVSAVVMPRTVGRRTHPR